MTEFLCYYHQQWYVHIVNDAVEQVKSLLHMENVFQTCLIAIFYLTVIIFVVDFEKPLTNYCTVTAAGI